MTNKLKKGHHLLKMDEPIYKGNDHGEGKNCPDDKWGHLLQIETPELN